MPIATISAHNARRIRHSNGEWTRIRSGYVWNPDLAAAAHGDIKRVPIYRHPSL